MNIFGLNKNKHFSSKDILSQLDNCADEFTFPMLDNGYIFPITSKLTAYRDKERWALIIEVVGFNYRGGGHNGISNCLHIFGNCINTKPGTDSANFISLTENHNNILSFDEDNEESINPKATELLLRGEKVTINHNRDFYINKGIHLGEEDKISIAEFMRGLLPEYANDLLATENEIRERIPNDLPIILNLIEWNHPDSADAELPSRSETFKQIAKVLESGDTNYYKPTLAPNNHWSNWPDGGML